MRKPKTPLTISQLLEIIEAEATQACDTGCEGRCRKCPADTIRDAVAAIREELD